jgi:hypothetical protein
MRIPIFVVKLVIWYRRRRGQVPPREPPQWEPLGDFGKCWSYGLFMAGERGSAEFGVNDLLAGMYLVSFERLAKYWAEPERLEEVLKCECGMFSKRWEYWLRYHDDRALARKSTSRFFCSPAKVFRESNQLTTVMESAAAVSRQCPSRLQDRAPLVGPEDVLLAIATDATLELGRRLVDSGLDLDRLERWVRSWKPSSIDYL